MIVGTIFHPQQNATFWGTRVGGKNFQSFGRFRMRGNILFITAAIPAAVWNEPGSNLSTRIYNRDRFNQFRLSLWFQRVRCASHSRTANSLAALPVLPRYLKHEFIPDFRVFEVKTPHIHATSANRSVKSHTDVGRSMQIEVGKRAASGTRSPLQEGEPTNNLGCCTSFTSSLTGICLSSSYFWKITFLF